LYGKKFHYEQQCFARGHLHVAGVDEVGMGCLAGPVVAAAVILRPDDIPKGIDDSKKLSAPKREALDIEIRARALSFAIGTATVEEIDTINIFHAARLAMVRAIHQLTPCAHHILLDGSHGIKIGFSQTCIVKGDAISVSIGAASILAKVYRDRLMRELDDSYPGYRFADHKGYGSVVHRQALQNLGPTPWHRKSFSWTPV
jgi:ribonuclease HII